jgi:hypothetical protein
MCFSAAACLWLLAQTLEAGRGPQPAPTPVSWELDFKFLDPQRIEVLEPGSDKPEVYWYLVYTVTNRSDRGVFFFPTFQLVTEDLRVIDTDKGISKLVFDAIRARHRKTHKYLVHPTKAIGALLVGDDNSRESVAIWRASLVDVNSFTIYVAGLSGETRLVPNPSWHADDAPSTQAGENPKYYTLRKTLEIRYNLPGSATGRAEALPERVSVRWVMR